MQFQADILGRPVLRSLNDDLSLLEIKGILAGNDTLALGAGVVSMYALQLASGRPSGWSTGTTTTAPVPTKLICRNGFKHHAAMNATHCAAPLAEALGNYLGWDVYHHQPASEE